MMHLTSPLLLGFCFAVVSSTSIMSPPISVQARVASRTTVILTWVDTQLGRSQIPTDDRYYTIRYRSGNGSTPFTYKNASLTYSVINNLQSNTRYSFEVRVTRGQSRSAWSLTQHNRILRSGVPGPIPNVFVLNVTSSTIRLQWMEPETGGDVEGYTMVFGHGPTRQRIRIWGNTKQYTLNDLDADTSYEISLRANNDKGEGAPTNVIAVKTKSESPTAMTPPTGIKAEVTSPRTVNLTWVDTSLGGRQVPTDDRYYTIRYRSGNASTPFTNKNSSRTYTVIDNLRPNTMYSFEVMVTRGRSRSLWSMTTQNRTLQGGAPGPVPFVYAENVTSSTITLQWGEPQTGGNVDGYTVMYGHRPTRNNIMTIRTDTKQYTLTNLDADTLYEISVTAFNDLGQGPPPDSYMFRTKSEQMPGKPRIQSVSVSSKSAVVQWLPPVEGGIIVGYKLTYGTSLNQRNEVRISDPGRRTYNLTDLEPGTQYVVSLSAYNGYGLGQGAHDMFSTKEEAVGCACPLIQPIRVETGVVSDTAILVRWYDLGLQPDQTPRDGRVYTVRYKVVGSYKYAYKNVTELVAYIVDLQPDTNYEFTVKVAIANRESRWSFSATNRTGQAVLKPPYDIEAIGKEGDPTAVVLSWKPAQVHGERITGYLVFYSKHQLMPLRQWNVEGVIGSRRSYVIRFLQPDTTYYFTVKARTPKVYTPLSDMVEYHTPQISPEDQSK